MSRKELGDSAVGFSQSNGGALRRALGWILKSAVFEDLSFHGNSKWQPVQLVALALLWVWSSKAALTDAFSDAQRWSTKLFGKAALTAYQGLVGALATWTPELMPLLWDRIHRLMEQTNAEHFGNSTVRCVPFRNSNSTSSTPVWLGTRTN